LAVESVVPALMSVLATTTGYVVAAAPLFDAELETAR
jgi:hypothetical protein